MPEDEWAQQLLNLMGLLQKPLKQRETKSKVKSPLFEGELRETTQEINKPQFPDLNFQDLLPEL